MYLGKGTHRDSIFICENSFQEALKKRNRELIYKEGAVIRSIRLARLLKTNFLISLKPDYN